MNDRGRNAIVRERVLLNLSLTRSLTIAFLPVSLLLVNCFTEKLRCLTEKSIARRHSPMFNGQSPMLDRKTATFSRKV